MKKLLLLGLVFTLMGCAGNFTSTVTPGYAIPQGEEIALTYLDHADVNVSNEATAILLKQMTGCGIFNFKTAEQTEEILQANNLTLPRRLTESFVTSLSEHLSAKYLITGGVSIWKKGSVGFPAASSTEVSASLTMYDLTTGKVVWTVSGQEEGGSGIFAEGPEQKAPSVFRKMLLKWPGFCKN